MKPTRASLVRDVLVLLVLAGYAVPYFWQVLTSLKPEAELLSLPPLLPSRITWEHYRAVIEQSLIPRALANSLGVALVTTVVGLGARRAGRVRAGAPARARQERDPPRHRRGQRLSPDRHREPALSADARARPARHVDGRSSSPTSRSRSRWSSGSSRDSSARSPRSSSRRRPSTARPAPRSSASSSLPLVAPGMASAALLTFLCELERVPVRLHVHGDGGEPHRARGARALPRRLRGAMGRHRRRVDPRQPAAHPARRRAAAVPDPRPPRGGAPGLSSGEAAPRRVRMRAYGHEAPLLRVRLMPLTADRSLNMKLAADGRTRHVSVFGNTYDDSSSHQEATRSPSMIVVIEGTRRSPARSAPGAVPAAPASDKAHATCRRTRSAN